MARDREIACIHYISEGECDLNKEGTFRKQCQKCRQYRKLPGGKPARTDSRRQRQERRMRKEKWDY